MLKQMFWSPQCLSFWIIITIFVSFFYHKFLLEKKSIQSKLRREPEPKILVEYISGNISE